MIDALRGDVVTRTRAGQLSAYEELQRHPLTYGQDEVVEVVRRYLAQVKKLGCRTFVDCTTVGLGRDARLLKRVSEEIGGDRSAHSHGGRQLHCVRRALLTLLCIHRFRR